MSSTCCLQHGLRVSRTYQVRLHTVLRLLYALLLPVGLHLLHTELLLRAGLHLLHTLLLLRTTLLLRRQPVPPMAHQRHPARCLVVRDAVLRAARNTSHGQTHSRKRLHMQPLQWAMRRLLRSELLDLRRCERTMLLRVRTRGSAAVLRSAQRHAARSQPIRTAASALLYLVRLRRLASMRRGLGVTDSDMSEYATPGSSGSTCSPSKRGREHELDCERCGQTVRPAEGWRVDDDGLTVCGPCDARDRPLPSWAAVVSTYPPAKRGGQLDGWRRGFLLR